MTPPETTRGAEPASRGRLATLAIVLSISATTMDASAINVALPVIGESMGVAPSDVTIVVGIYQLVVVAFLFPIASLAEIVGYRRIYLCGLAIFVLGAGLNATAMNVNMLIATRVLQASGAACVMSVNLAVLRQVVPPERLGRAIGLNAMAVALSTTLGPTIAGWLVSVASWHAVVMMGLPLGLTGLVLAFANLPESDRHPHRFDARSAVLSAVALGVVFYALMAAGRGADVWLVAALLVTGLATGVVLLRGLRGQDAPLVPLDLFRERAFRLAALTSVCAFSTQMLAYVSLPFAMQIGMDFTPAESGMLLSAWPLALLIVAPLAARLADGPYNAHAASTGLAIMAAGMVLLATMPADAGALAVAARLALCGAGFGLFQTPNNRSIMSVAPRHRSSAASSSLGTARLLGQALGTALATFGLALGPSGALHALFAGAALSAGGAIAAMARTWSRSTK